MNRSLKIFFIVSILFVKVSFAESISKEYPIKAAFVYNFIKFTEWPNVDDKTINICILGKSQTHKYLKKIILNKKVKGKILKCKDFWSLEKKCDVLFIAKQSKYVNALQFLKGKPVLTIGENKDFIKNGGMIRFYIKDGKIRFEINNDVVKKADLVISSKLLNLAQRK